MQQGATAQVTIKKVNAENISGADDILAAEEPLEIRLIYTTEGKRAVKSISVTMRTPGNDAELATGFLYTEGIITSAEQVTNIAHLPASDDNIILVTLAEGVSLNRNKLERNFYTTSSCGVCGKSSIDAVRTVCQYDAKAEDNLSVSKTLIYTLPELLRKNQEVFENTGGLHASALFDIAGNLLLVHEDVGRHNALDKLIGTALKQNQLPLNQHILLLSGRTSFELIQKAAMAGIKIIAAVGAPSTLAVQLAEESGMTLLGFLRGERFNIYTGAQRIAI